MPRSSTSSISPEVLQELETQFYQFLDSLSFDEKKKFFSEFLTNEEKMMMYKRLALYWCLLEGYSLAKIQQMIGVTHDTTRVYNKKKNQLSQEFKELVGRIKGDVEEVKEENSQSATVESQQDINEEPHEHVEPTFEMPAVDDKPGEIFAYETSTEPETTVTPTDDFRIETREDHDYEEKHEEQDMQLTESQTPSQQTPEASEEPENKQESSFFGEQSEQPAEHSPIMHSFEDTLSSEQPKPEEQSAQNQETQQSEDQPKEEKKKGWGKFFGF